MQNGMNELLEDALSSLHTVQKPKFLTFPNLVFLKPPFYFHHTDDQNARLQDCHLHSHESRTLSFPVLAHLAACMSALQP